MGILRACFKYLKCNVVEIKLTYPAFLSSSLLFHTTSAYSLKTLQNGLKHRETTKKTKGKQGKSVLFQQHYI